MSRLLTALADARSLVDLNIAAGGAISSWERAKRTLLLGVAAVLVIISAASFKAYTDMQERFDRAEQARTELILEMQRAQQGQALILEQIDEMDEAGPS